ncbi:OLC1v1018337C1 [Oldenlandia corymbosa var. corymbosa]|uniref:OLC1v1018337C1 n=1 Tax=Oldenlandia corymbosa var. corymbosa TaxID=529605 RepID=A0AAV1EBL0_OLDCO|nr:OLC1v1018337C1 [Oldenlandia corymbosa var. corymbosa]
MERVIRSNNLKKAAFLSCLNTSTATLSEAKQAHTHVIKEGLSSQTRIATKLLSIYANHQCFTDAYSLLCRIPEPDILSFASLINACSKFDRFSDALKVFVRMLGRSVFPDARILPTAIKACAGLSALELGRQVHAFGVTSGLMLDSFVESSLVHMYVKCDELNYARKVLARMSEPDVASCSALASGYAKKGDVGNANVLIREMEKQGIQPNLISWNGMISGFNQSGAFSEAIGVFKVMHSGGFKCDGVSLSCALAAVGDLEDLIVGVQIHGCVIKLGFRSDKYVVSSLLDMYGKCGCASDIIPVFEEIDHKDVGACNALIASLSRAGMVAEAVKTFKQCQEQGIELDVVSWTSLIAGCMQNGNDIEAVDLFREMQVAGIEPNYVTIPCLLTACASIAALAHGKAAHCFSLKRGFSDDLYVCSALIDMYANCGRIQAARRCFDWEPSRNLVCWNAMISGYAMHGRVKEAIDIFHLMQSSGHKPDFVSFTSVLSACSQRGLVEEGKRFFSSMSADFGIKPRMEHYACMVSLLGRTGKLEESYSLIKDMPFAPDACVWGALLSSCRVHQNTRLGKVAANALFELEPNNSGNYILLSNIYAAKGKWNEVHKVRDMMKSIGIRKNPGCSWIEVKNKVHTLLAGDSSHPQMKQILEKVNKLSMEMKMAGYLPDTKFVLQDVEELEEREHILCGHSEKLAIVFGILNTNPGTSLTVMKNLRICGDCHTSIKFISSFEEREILVRDTNRFHHFKDGMCSCEDLW